jgi:ATP-dependent Lon protease
VILPRQNERDLEDVPAELRREMEFVLVDTAEEVLARAREPQATAALVPSNGKAA